MEKIINNIEIENIRYYIKSTGETRRIKIRGTRGAGFSMEINDSSGACILNDPLQNIYIPDTGLYIVTQEFPDITTSASGGLTEEYYDIIFKPHADVEADIQEQRLYQYPDVTITLKATSSVDSPEITIRDNDGVYSSTTVTMPARSKGVVNKTLNLTINEASGTDGFFYVKNTFNNSLSKNTTFTRKVTTSDKPKLDNFVVLKPLTTKTIGSTTSGNVTKGNENDLMDNNIESGMRVYGELTKSKIVYKSLEVPTCRRATNKFALSDTVGLFTGMTGKIKGFNDFIVTSVDCDKNITVNKKIIIPENTDVDFVYEIKTSIAKVRTQIDADGNACVDLQTKITVVNDMVLELDTDKSKVSSDFIFSGSGTDVVTLKGNFEFSNPGLKDVTHTLDIDNMISRIPNIKDFKVDVPKNTSGYVINTLKGDIDQNVTKTIDAESAASGKVVAINKAPVHGTATISSRNITYVPNPNFVGSDEVLYTLNDGTNTSLEGKISITVK